MFQSHSTFLLLLACFSIHKVSASNICAFSERPCANLSACCNNINAGVCCVWTSPFGVGIQFSAMPAVWSGLAFGTPTCTGTLAGGVSAPGGVCLSTPLQTRFTSSGWLAQPLRRRGIGELEVESTEESYVFPDTIAYTTEDGINRVVKVPEGQFERLSGLIAVGAYEAEFAELEEAEDI